MKTEVVLGFKGIDFYAVNTNVLSVYPLIPFSSTRNIIFCWHISL